MATESTTGATRKRQPKGSLPISETDWSGDHVEIKDAIGAEAPVM